MNFRVGQKVVKVRFKGYRPRDERGYGDEHTPKIGVVYTVRGFDHDGFDGPSLWLEEIVNPVHSYSWYDGSIRTQECSWPAASFRPLTVKKTDISIFTEMLKPRELVRAND